MSYGVFRRSAQSYARRRRRWVPGRTAQVTVSRSVQDSAGGDGTVTYPNSWTNFEPYTGNHDPGDPSTWTLDSGNPARWRLNGTTVEVTGKLVCTNSSTLLYGDTVAILDSLPVPVHPYSGTGYVTENGPGYYILFCRTYDPTTDTWFNGQAQWNTPAIPPYIDHALDLHGGPAVTGIVIDFAGVSWNTIAVATITDSAGGDGQITARKVVSRAVADSAGGDATVSTLHVAIAHSDDLVGLPPMFLQTVTGIVDHAAGDATVTGAKSSAVIIARSVADSAGGDGTVTQRKVLPRTVGESAGGDSVTSRMVLAARTATDSAGGDASLATGHQGQVVVVDSAGGDGSTSRRVTVSRIILDSCGGDGQVVGVQAGVPFAAIVDHAGGDSTVVRVFHASRTVTDGGGGDGSFARFTPDALVFAEIAPGRPVEARSGMVQREGVLIG